MRVGLVKAALQLTPDQEKLWPPVEAAIRARAENREARLERLAEFHDGGSMDSLSDRNPVEFMQRRADELIQRGNDAKRLADAWQPLYQTLSEDQKKRMALASFIALRAMRGSIAHRGDFEDDDD